MSKTELRVKETDRVANIMFTISAVLFVVLIIYVIAIHNSYQ